MDYAENNKLISVGKFERLARRTPLSTEELASFINRQLVETRQSTKAIISILQAVYPDCEPVWSKAGHISDFRKEFGFVKCRDINDLHHAKDAYLNIVVGNAYHDQFTANPYQFLKGGNRYTLNTKEIFKRDIKRGDNVGWLAGEDGTIAMVKKTMARNNILYTRMAVIKKGQIYDLNPLRKSKGQIPLKQGMSVEKYGGYNSASTSYFMLVQSVGKKGKIMKTIEAVPMYIGKDNDKIKEYLASVIGLEKPVIIVPSIKCNSLMKINGFLFHLTGKTGSSITGSPATQIIFGGDNELYIKKIGKFMERRAKNKEAKITEFDGITVEKNLAMYDMLLQKHLIPGFVTRPSGQVKTLEKGRGKFDALTVEEQCIALNNILLLFANKPVRTDLSLIGGSKNAGVIMINKEITGCKETILYNQSPTGLFEQQIDLLKL